ncbi:MAG: hypothetical protein L3J24_00690 [Xanthomonadales bacterium]|nr:hypothetical protein [Xanthomonadales bacterium]
MTRISDMQYIYAIFLLLFSTLQSLSAATVINKPTGLLSPQNHKPGPPGTKAINYQIKIYDSAKGKKLLGDCKADSYFKVPTGNYKNRGKAFAIKCLVDYPFTRIQTDYEFYELVSWGEKNNRYKVKLSQHLSSSTVEYLWVEIEPRLNFSNYEQRITKDADAFTKEWDQILFSAPDSKKQIKIKFSKNLESFNFDIKKTIEIDDKVWIQIEKIYDYESECEGERSKPLLHRNLWVPLFNKQGQYNITGFSNPRGC